MNIERLSLRLRVFLFFALLAVVGIAGIAAGLTLGFNRLDMPEASDGFVFGGIIAGFALVGVVTWVWLMFDENVARPIQKLSGSMMARAHADVDEVLREDSARYLGDLAPAAEAVTRNLVDTRNALAQAVALETTRLVEEKERLAALAADMPHGVVLCSGRHKIAFYNGAAADILGADHAPGLDHALFDFLRPAPIRSAYARLVAGEGGGDHVLPLTVAMQHGRSVLRARMRLLHAPDEGDTAPGYLLSIEDATADMADRHEREMLLRRTFDRLRPALSNLRTIVAARDAVGANPELDAALASEIDKLSDDVERFAGDYDVIRGTVGSMTETRGSDIVDALTATLDAEGIAVAADVPEPVWLTLDATHIIALLTQLALHVTRDGAKALSLLITRENTGAMIALGWSGDPLTVGRLEKWLGKPLDVGIEGTTGRTVLDAHATDIWPLSGAASRNVLKLPVPTARRARPRPTTMRQATYDFDLLTKEPPLEVASARLSDLTYVVFDTETTGLLPSDGDEICQVAALRVVNMRLIGTETLDTLVDPGRSIPAQATQVHHITNAMVHGAPKIDVVGRRLHSFARGAVLVAHNAPFDLEFLRRHEADIGAKFTNPVLDTVLLSAIVFGQSEEHTLDAIATRLGVKIPPELRHTAMGDTVATAQVFIKMIRMCEERGLVTFSDVLAEARRHKRLLKDANQDVTA